MKQCEECHGYDMHLSSCSKFDPTVQPSMAALETTIHWLDNEILVIDTQKAIIRAEMKRLSEKGSHGK
jgi:hypothetical protein